jgi:hypothetical protein
VATIIEVPPKTQAQKTRRKRASRAAPPPSSNVIPLRKLKTGRFDPSGPDLLALRYILPASNGIEPFFDADGPCSCDLCLFLAEPRQHPHSLVITRHSRLAAAFTVLHSDCHVIAFAENDEFLFAANRLASIAINIERLHGEWPGSTVEHNLAALEQMASASRGAPQ